MHPACTCHVHLRMHEAAVCSASMSAQRHACGGMQGTPALMPPLPSPGPGSRQLPGARLNKTFPAVEHAIVSTCEDGNAGR